MILFFGDPKLKVFVVKVSVELSFEDIKKLSWVLESDFIELKEISEKEINFLKKGGKFITHVPKVRIIKKNANR